MALSFVEEVFLEEVASELSKAILGVIGKVVRCKGQLEQLKSTLEELTPQFREIEGLDGQIERDRIDEELRNRPVIKNLKDLLETGNELASKCSKTSSFNVFKMYWYSNKFRKWDESMDRFFKQNMLTEILCSIKQLQVSMRSLTELSSRDTSGGSSTRIWFEGSCAVPEIPAFTVGLEIPLIELKKELFRDEVRVLGVYGPGGCGKTTLATMLCHDEQVKAEFQNIYFLTISSSPNLKVILQNLVEEMVGGLLNDFGNDKNAINQLGNVLKKKQEETKPVLIVLDDIWQESIDVHKLVFETKGYKMLITSRTEIEFQTPASKYSLKMLSDPDARTLFRQVACTQGGNENYVPNEVLLNQMVRCCKGSPLALNVIAKLLCGKPERIWTSTVCKLSKGSIIESHKDLLDCLATSLQFLDDKVQECFLDLGCFLEDQKIPASALIDIWIEFYKLDENIAYENLVTLSKQNLVNLIESTRKEAGELDGDLNKLIVVQHDLLRELAIYKNRQERKRFSFITDKEEGLCESWKEEAHQHLGARLASINTGEMRLTSCCDMELPEVEGLILNFSAMEYTLPPFMKKMGKLKVLIITNHGCNYAKLLCQNQKPKEELPTPNTCLPLTKVSFFPTVFRRFCFLVLFLCIAYLNAIRVLFRYTVLAQHKLKDFSTCSYLSNLKRLRLERVSIPSLNEITIQLVNLQKISLIMCEIGQALSNCTVNFPHILPNLKEINIDYCNDLVKLPPGICDIVHLQKLSITNCHNLSALPEEIGRITDLDMLRLHSCTRLLELPDSIRTLQKLRFIDISDCLSIEKLPEGMGELHGLRKLDMRQCAGVKELPNSVMDLEHLKDVICDEETAGLWEPLRCYYSELNIKVRKDDINLNWLHH